MIRRSTVQRLMLRAVRRVASRPVGLQRAVRDDALQRAAHRRVARGAVRRTSTKQACVRRHLQCAGCIDVIIGAL